jgi:hypothetical protein
MDMTAKAWHRGALRGLTAALVIAGISIGCGSNGTEGRDAPEGGGRVLQVWTPESGSRLGLVQQRADQFSAEHPGVTI